MLLTYDHKLSIFDRYRVYWLFSKDFTKQRTYCECYSPLQCHFLLDSLRKHSQTVSLHQKCMHFFKPITPREKLAKLCSFYLSFLNGKIIYRNKMQLISAFHKNHLSISFQGIGTKLKAYASRKPVRKRRELPKKSTLQTKKTALDDYASSADRLSADADFTSVDNADSLNDKLDVQSSTKSSSRSAVLQACIITSGLIFALGMAIRQVGFVPPPQLGIYALIFCSQLILLLRSHQTAVANIFKIRFYPFSNSFFCLILLDQQVEVSSNFHYREIYVVLKNRSTCSIFSSEAVVFF